MKKADKRPTRAQREAMGEKPATIRCAGCGHAFPSKFALKEHRLDCNVRSRDWVGG